MLFSGLFFISRDTRVLSSPLTVNYTGDAAIISICDYLIGAWWFGDVEKEKGLSMPSVRGWWWWVTGLP
jgi:hypothetical protein